MAKYDPTSPPVPAPEAGLPNPIQPPSANPPELDRENLGNDADAEDGDEAAYERGAEAGNREAADNKNPYPEGSSRAKAFEHGYLDAQKIRRDDKPPR
ncbi:Sf3a2-prov protein [Rhizobium jaguaris]|uniref:Sf3a2-prov protein n=1 Tax=Rhizobium jaguaris TaxID=1312183 RepID=A0A387FVF5_9HYPH|nr:Sf3a2-prov protein [Rhizobium jaguaris]AYG62659.1 Sf3a2-prov protein [Rhizobium jaguaris]